MQVAVLYPRFFFTKLNALVFMVLLKALEPFAKPVIETEGLPDAATAGFELGTTVAASTKTSVTPIERKVALGKFMCQLSGWLVFQK